jgi:glycosyltransferase involved in cell wall biosynthesis
MDKFRLAVQGWRGVNHSFAMVNQNQLLAWAREPGLELFHIDAPLYQAHWAGSQLGAGFSAEDEQLIRGLAAPPDEVCADVLYRIHMPMAARAQPGRHRRQVTFMVTEFGLSPRSFADGTPDLASYTSDGNFIVTPSRWARERLIDFGFAPEGIEVVRHGVNRRSFHPASEDERRQHRQRLNWTDEHFVFANVGVATWNKGIDLLIGAFARVRRDHPQARLVLKDHAGLYGMGVDQTMKKVAEANPGLLTQEVLDSIAILSGNLTQAQLRTLYVCADCYVSPYRAEGFNLPVLEAIACGTPVIVTAGGATDDFCDGPWAQRLEGQPRGISRDGLQNGRYVDIAVDTLIEAMKARLAAGVKPPRLEGCAWQALLDRMSWDAVGAEALALLQQQATQESRIDPASRLDRLAA